jgi:hypothetical protein
LEESLSSIDVADGLYLLVLALISFCIALSLTVLLLLHTYLACAGLSSWEYFSWMRITYLKVWPRKYGSPFGSKSKFVNFKNFFVERSSNNIAR